MQIISFNYFFASITAYIGLLAGIILIKIAPEEQKPGKKYFILLKKILFFLILASLLFFYKIHIAISLILLFFIIVLMANEKIKLDKSAPVYLLLGIAFYLSSKIPNLFVAVPVLIFLYGLPTASLIINPKKINYYDIFARNLWFFVPVVALYFI